MKRISTAATLAVVALLSSVFAARDASAIELTLNLVQAQSSIALSGSFGGLPFQSQDTAPVQAGTTDLNLALPSMTTTFQGTITIDVDNVNAASSIQLLSSVANADVGGKWVPKVLAFEDLNGNGDFGEFGAPPDGDSRPAANAPPGPGEDADWGFRIRHPSFGVTLAAGAFRDVEYNITSPIEAVNGSGEFNSLSENFEFTTAWLDYWVAPAAGNLQGRTEFAGGDEDNAAVALSKYTVTPLPNNKRELKLLLPVDINIPGDDADFFMDGQLVATLIVPEPATLVLSGMALAFVGAFTARRRK